MKFLATITVIISYLSISNAEESSSVTLRGSVSESRDDAEAPTDFSEYFKEEDEIGRHITYVRYPARGNNPSDFLLSAHSIQGASSGSPFEPLKDCTERSNTDDACIEDLNPPRSSRHYDALIKSTSTRDSLLSAITKAEGGSLGSKVSSGASYVSEKSDSIQSISFMIGGHRFTNTRSPDNVSKLKLNTSSRDLLARDPKGFLQAYGSYYVKAVTYGGSFIGSFDLTAGSSADSSDLEVEASFPYSNGIFTVEGSTEFTNRQKSTESNLDLSSSYQSIPNVRGNVIEAPYDLTTQYEIWNEEVNDNPAPLYVYIGRWWDSQDVQNVLLDPANNVSEETLNLFTRTIEVDEATAEVATNEVVGSRMMMNTIGNMMEWPEVRNDSEISAMANELYQEARKYTSEYNLMDELQLYLLQEEIVWDETEGINNPYGSWLHYKKSLAPRYNDFLNMLL
jgi:hypothetical protein